MGKCTSLFATEDCVPHKKGAICRNERNMHKLRDSDDICALYCETGHQAALTLELEEVHEQSSNRYI